MDQNESFRTYLVNLVHVLEERGLATATGSDANGEGHGDALFLL